MGNVGGWHFWPWWVLANAVGVAVGGVVVLLFWIASSDLGRAVVGWALGGVVVAAMQWLVLRYHLKGFHLWGLITFLVWPMVGSAVSATAFFVWLWFFEGWDRAHHGRESGWLHTVDLGLLVAIGAAVGAMQWLVLQHQLAGGGWLVVASAAAWAASLAVAAFLLSAGCGTSSDPYFNFSGLCMVVYGPVAGWAAGTVAGAVVTGGAVLWLLPLPRPEALKSC